MFEYIYNHQYMKRIILNHQIIKVCYFVQFDNKNIELIKKNYHLFLYIIVFHYICMQVYNLKKYLTDEESEQFN